MGLVVGAVSMLVGMVVTGALMAMALVVVALVALFAAFLVALLVVAFLVVPFLVAVVVAVVVAMAVVAVVVVVGALHRGDLELLVPSGLPRVGSFLPHADHGVLVCDARHFVLWWGSEMVRW